MSLDKTVFIEQIKALSVFYPADRVEVTKKILDGWWPVFSNFTTKDFVSGIISCRSSSRRFPTAGILETAIRDIQRERSREELNERMEAHEETKREEANYFKSSSGSYTQAQSKDCLKAIMIGLSEGKEVGIEALLKVGEKYPSNLQGIMACIGAMEEWKEVVKPENEVVAA